MKETRKSIWVQIFLAYKYVNEYLKTGIPKKYDITPYEYFLLMDLRAFEDFTFYELNKYTPMDGKSLHNKVSSFVERGLMSREYTENKTSILNLTDKGREIIKDIYINSLDGTEDYFEKGELLRLHSDLSEFNKKMRKILDIELTESALNKINIDLL